MAILIILVYGTDSTPKSAIPRGIPRFPVFPTKAVAKYIDWVVLSLKINLLTKINIKSTNNTMTK